MAGAAAMAVQAFERNEVLGMGRLWRGRRGFASARGGGFLARGGALFLGEGVAAVPIRGRGLGGVAGAAFGVVLA